MNHQEVVSTASPKGYKLSHPCDKHGRAFKEKVLLKPSDEFLKAFFVPSTTFTFNKKGVSGTNNLKD